MCMTTLKRSWGPWGCEPPSNGNRRDSLICGVHNWASARAHVYIHFFQCISKHQSDPEGVEVPNLRLTGIGVILWCEVQPSICDESPWVMTMHFKSRLRWPKTIPSTKGNRSDSLLLEVLIFVILPRWVETICVKLFQQRFHSTWRYEKQPPPTGVNQSDTLLLQVCFLATSVLTWNALSWSMATRRKHLVVNFTHQRVTPIPVRWMFRTSTSSGNFCVSICIGRTCVNMCACQYWVVNSTDQRITPISVRWRFGASRSSGSF